MIRQMLEQGTLFYYFDLLLLIAVCAFAEPTLASLWTGALVSGVGLLVRLWSAGYPRDQEIFAIYGPYRFVRYPYYLGSFLLLLGFCLAGRQALLLIAMVVGTAFLYRWTFRVQDTVRQRSDYSLFAQYRMRVPSFLPQLLPFPRSDNYEGRFQWKRALLGYGRRELDTMLACVVGYLVLFLFIQFRSSFRELETVRLVASAVFLAGVVLRFLSVKHRKSLAQSARQI